MDIGPLTYTRTTNFVVLSLLAITIGCGSNAGGTAGPGTQGGPDAKAPEGGAEGETPEGGLAPEATVMDMLFEGQTFQVDGKKWAAERGQLQNMVVEERKENADGTHTARVLFELSEGGESVAIKANVNYRLRILKLLEGEGSVASHEVIGVETISAKKLDK